MNRRIKVILLAGLAVTVVGTAGTLAAGAGQTLRLWDGTCQLAPEQGIGQGFVDENDDGICDNREGAVGLGGGAGRHGGGGWKN